MKYREILNKIYFNYKKNDKYEFDSFIKFYKENNTNIVRFEYNDKSKNMNGIIIDQNHSIFIYYKTDECVFFSKTNIVFGNRAIIYNCILNNGNVEYQETVGRDFKKREEIFNFSNNDIVVNDNLLDDDFEDIIKNIDSIDCQKSKQKGLKI